MFFSRGRADRNKTEDWMQGSLRINIKIIPHKRRFIGNFCFYTFELMFGMIFHPSSEFKEPKKEACNKARKILIYFFHWSFESCRRRKDPPNRRFKSVKIPINLLGIIFYLFLDSLPFNLQFHNKVEFIISANSKLNHLFRFSYIW